MARGKYGYWLTDEGLTLLRGWARNGLTDKEIADNANINPATLYDWKKKYPEIDEALKKGKEVVDFQVEDALLKRALDGDTTAQIFWLKNRRPDRWRDKLENKITISDIDQEVVKEVERMVKDDTKASCPISAG